MVAADDVVPALVALTQWGDACVAPEEPPILYRASTGTRVRAMLRSDDGSSVSSRTAIVSRTRARIPSTCSSETESERGSVGDPDLTRAFRVGLDLDIPAEADPMRRVAFGHRRPGHSLPATPQSMLVASDERFEHHFGQCSAQRSARNGWLHEELRTCVGVGVGVGVGLTE